MRVLIACEESGTVRDAFIRHGHDAVSCDLQPSRSNFGPHVIRDAVKVAYEGIWDLMIAHPPCTRLTNSGVCWLHKRNLWKELDEACEFFSSLLNAPIPQIAIENPIPHKYALERIGRKYNQIVQPYQFGHPERKATCFWLNNLSPLKPTNIVPLPDNKRLAQRLHWLPPSPDRARLRSITFPAIAEAMASQWGNKNAVIQPSLFL